MSGSGREVGARRMSWRLSGSLLLAAFVFAGPGMCTEAQSADDELLAGLTADFARLAPQTIRPADGYIRYPCLIPAGYYAQMWDWDGFSIGAH